MKPSLRNFVILFMIFSICMLSFTGFTRGNSIRGVSSPKNLSGIPHREYITLDWDSPTRLVEDNQSYFIYRGLGSSPLQRIGQVNKTSYIDEDIESGRAYSYYVTAIYDDYNESTPSNRIEITARGYNTPTKPREVSAHAGNSKITIDWDTPFDDGGRRITGYNVYKGNHPEHITIERENIDHTRIKDENVTNGVEYFYVVTAVNDRGESDWTEVVYTEPLSNITKPTPPTGIYAFSGAERNEIYWRPSRDMGKSTLIEYRIYRSEQGSYELIGSTKETSYVDKDVSVNESFEYRLTAVNGEGESAYSKDIDAGPVSIDVPETPSDIHAESIEESIVLSWRVEQDIRLYLVFRGRESDDLSFYEVVDGSWEFTDTDIEENKTYYYSLKAVDELGSISQYSETIEITSFEEEPEEKNADGLIRYFIYVPIGIIIILSVIMFINKEKLSRIFRAKKDEQEQIQVQQVEIEERKDDEEIVVKSKDIHKVDSVESEGEYSDSGQIEIKKREDLIDD